MLETIDPAIRAEIECRLAEIEQSEDIRFLFAIESGSRAWGFPSPDSDFDVRFVYARRRDWYLSVGARSDVIEQPIVDDIDLNGWDISKALQLTLKSNAVISEWLASPIVYRSFTSGANQLRELANRVFNPRGYALHYANLGRNNADRWLAGSGEVQVKRYFYALRPALAVRTLRLDPAGPPPMNLDSLMASAQIDVTLRDEIGRLVELKARTREKSNLCRMPSLDKFIATELERAGEVPERRINKHAFSDADQIFRQIVLS